MQERGNVVRISIAPGLATAAKYGTWLSIIAIALTAVLSSADAHAPYGIIAVFLVVLCACIAVRVLAAVSRPAGPAA